MSTWLYLECADHDPPLSAREESGQHLYDLPTIREVIAHRDALIAAARLDSWPGGSFERNTVRFLVDHPRCRLRIRDEYGNEHPLEDQ